MVHYKPSGFSTVVNPVDSVCWDFVETTLLNAILFILTASPKSLLAAVITSNYNGIRALYGQFFKFRDFLSSADGSLRHCAVLPISAVNGL